MSDDPEIGELLQFEPVERRFKREDGWTPALQRLFILNLAKHGSPGKACDAIGKRRSGIDKLYKVAGADSFRAAWHRAVEIAEERGAAKIEAEHEKAANLKAPFLDHRRKSAPPPQPEPEDDDWSVEQKLEVIESIVKKYLHKVRAEREARLAGEIVAADFYLRQLTVVEIGLDLMAEITGYSAFALLQSAQRDGRNLYDIAETPFSRALDVERRKQWRQAEEPDRPEHPPERYLSPFVPTDHEGQGYWLEPSRSSYGALTTPAEGFTQEQWAEMNYEEQLAARQAEFAREAAKQVEWEAKARREFESRRGSAT